MSPYDRQIQIKLSRYTCHPNDPVWTAAAIVHEACHLHQWNQGVIFTHDNLRIHEPPCYRKQIEFFNSVAPGRYNAYIGRLQGYIREYEG